MIPKTLTLEFVANVVGAGPLLFLVPPSGVFGGIGVGTIINNCVVEIFVPDYLDPTLFGVLHGRRMGMERSMFDMRPQKFHKSELRGVIRSFLT